MRALALVLLASACSPSVNPQSQKDVDNQLAQLAQQNRQIPAPSSFEPMPMAVGQWTRHKVVDEKGRPGLMTYKLIGQDGDAYWVEVVAEQYTGKSLIKMLVNFGDHKDPSTMDIKDVWMADPKGRVEHIDGATLSMVKGMMKSKLADVNANWQGQPQEDVTVLAGSFSGCYKGKSEVSVMGHTYSSMSWRHPAVPLSGVVKSQGLDRPRTMELVDFGVSGAQSEFPAAAPAQ